MSINQEGTVRATESQFISMIRLEQIQLCSKRKCNILINVLYRSPVGLMLPFENFLKDIFNKTKNSNKKLLRAGDFNVNLLDYEKRKKVQEFLNHI